MMSNRFLLLSALALASASTFVAPARAEDNDAVLFKIHDVVPIKNSENQTTACDYHVTVYNRSEKNISSASLLLTWTDQAIDAVIRDEKNMRAKSQNSQEASTLPNTALTTPIQITSQVEIPKLAPQKQVSLRARIQSDRCFLLTENVEVQVKSCVLGEDNSSSDTRRRATASRSSNTPCDGLFQFVSPENPEYYRDFKPISYNDEQNQAQMKRNNDRIDINTQYDAVSMEIAKISTVLEGIKSDVPVDDVVGSSQNTSNTKNDAAAAQLDGQLQNLFPEEGDEEVVEMQETVIETAPAQAPAASTDNASSDNAPKSILPDNALQAPAGDNLKNVLETQSETSQTETTVKTEEK